MTPKQALKIAQFANKNPKYKKAALSLLEKEGSLFERPLSKGQFDNKKRLERIRKLKERYLRNVKKEQNREKRRRDIYFNYLKRQEERSQKDQSRAKSWTLIIRIENRKRGRSVYSEWVEDPERNLVYKNLDLRGVLNVLKQKIGGSWIVFGEPFKRKFTAKSIDQIIDKDFVKETTFYIYISKNKEIANTEREALKRFMGRGRKNYRRIDVTRDQIKELTRKNLVPGTGEEGARSMAKYKYNEVLDHKSKETDEDLNRMVQEYLNKKR